MSSLPTWAIYAVSLGSPLAAFLGVVMGHLISRRGASELDRRAKREESMRTLRWASELAVADNGDKGHLGVTALAALSASPWLQEEDQVFLDAVLETLVELQAAAYRRLSEAEVVQVEAPADARPRGVDPIDGKDAR